MCLPLGKLQAPAQATLRPAVWIPGIRSLHQKHERWRAEISPFDCFDEVLKALHTLELTEHLEIYKADRDHLTIQSFFYTKSCKWLDVVELEFQAAPESGTLVQARSFSSGFLPVWVPLSFLWNMVFFFVPFTDMGENELRLQRIRGNSYVDFSIVEPD